MHDSYSFLAFLTRWEYNFCRTFVKTPSDFLQETFGDTEIFLALVYMYFFSENASFAKLSLQSKAHSPQASHLPHSFYTHPFLYPYHYIVYLPTISH